MSRMPLPPGFTAAPFTLDEATKAGLGRGRLWSPGLTRPTSGVRSHVAVMSVAQRAWAFALVLPDDVAFSHATAAHLWGLPLPDEHMADVLHVMREDRRTRIRRHGCRGHLGLQRRVVERAHQLRVTGMPDTWVDLGARLGLDDLVVVGDEVAARLGSVSPLRDAVTRRGRTEGGPALREALTLVRVGSRSPMETRARLMFVGGGLPEPELNVDLTDESGEWLATCDFVWRGQKVVGEYQGEHHSSIEQRDVDNVRRQLAEDLGWRVIEVFARDVFHAGRRAQCLMRFAAALGVDARSLRLD